MTLLDAVARSHAVARLHARRAHRAAPMDEVAEIADEGLNPEEAAVASSMRGRIGDCLQTLPPDRADAIRRAYLGGEAYADLASRYGVPLNTIRTWLRRGLLTLRECLG